MGPQFSKSPVVVPDATLTQTEPLSFENAGISMPEIGRFVRSHPMGAGLEASEDRNLGGTLTPPAMKPSEVDGALTLPSPEPPQMKPEVPNRSFPPGQFIDPPRMREDVARSERSVDMPQPNRDRFTTVVQPNTLITLEKLEGFFSL